jgi:hypothetical protein
MDVDASLPIGPIHLGVRRSPVHTATEAYALTAEIAKRPALTLTGLKHERIGFPVEVHVAAPDDIWLSTAYQRETGYIAAHHYFRIDHRRYFAAFESIVAEHRGRPRWGKLHTLEADQLRRLYPRFDAFIHIRDRLDPGRAFDNAYLRRVLR